MKRNECFQLSIESYILLFICGLDLVSTIWAVTTGRAIEGNPVMSFYLREGLFPLVIAKLTLTVFPIIILEWCRKSRPRFVHRMLRVAIFVYVMMYVVVFVNQNIMSNDINASDGYRSGTSYSTQVDSSKLFHC